MKVYRTLKAEMVRVDLSVKRLAMQLGITERSLRNKINGITEFTLSESKKIKKIINEANETNGISFTLETLFEKASQ